MNFKAGDKVKLDNTNGDAYGLTTAIIEQAMGYKSLTISKVDDGHMSRIWFYEIAGYWNPRWFKKINAQLEFDFNV
jgi:hypothetical protein